MKKILNIFCALLLVAGLAGCSDDKEPVELKLVSSETEYTASGGIGTIEVEGASIRSVDSSQDWCTPTQQGGQIKLNVAANPDLTERIAKITITPSEDIKPLNVYVIQQGSRFILDSDLVYDEGVYFGIIPMRGGSLEVKVKSDLPYSVDIITPELEYAQEGDNIIFSLGAINEPRILRARILAPLDNDREIAYTLEINQTTAYADLIGDWKLVYYDQYLTGTKTERIVTFKERVAGKSFTLSSIPVDAAGTSISDIEIQYITSEGTISIQNAQYLGEMSDRYVHLSMFEITGQGSSTYNWSYWMQNTYSFKFSLDTTADNIKFEKPVSNTGTTLGGWVNVGYTSRPPSAYTNTITTNYFFFPEFIKIEEELD